MFGLRPRYPIVARYRSLSRVRGLARRLGEARRPGSGVGVVLLVVATVVATRGGRSRVLDAIRHDELLTALGRDRSHRIHGRASGSEAGRLMVAPGCTRRIRPDGRCSGWHGADFRPSKPLDRVQWKTQCSGNERASRNCTINGASGGRQYIDTLQMLTFNFSCPSTGLRPWKQSIVLDRQVEKRNQGEHIALARVSACPRFRLFAAAVPDLLPGGPADACARPGRLRSPACDG